MPAPTAWACVKRIEPPYSVAIYTKTISVMGIEISSVVIVKNIGHARIDARDELMVRPHDEAQNAGGPGGVQNRPVSEQFLARKHREDFRHDSHRRQQHDVHFRVAEEPEQVLPQQRIAAATRIVEAVPTASDRRAA